MISFILRLSSLFSLFLFFISLVSSDLICEDKTKSCKKWAETKKLCDENPKYKKQRFYVSMSKLCKKTCLMCGDDDASLFDTDSRCYSYFKKGYCDMKPHQGFMLRRCQYSCRNTIRSGIMSPGRGNFQRNNPPAQQAQHKGYWNQQQGDARYPQQQYPQQYPQYGQQYAQNYGQQQQHNPQQMQNYGQQPYQQQQYGLQNDQQQSVSQFPQTAMQQAPVEQQTADQQLQTQSTTSQSLADMPVQVQAVNNPTVARKHKLEKKKEKQDDDMEDDDAVNDTDDMN